MDCCEPNKGNTIDQTRAVDERYGNAAEIQEACLCSPVEFDSKLLTAIPKEIIERDYGCGDPTKWVKEKDVVLDLGSGSGKNAFICSQIVGPEGMVIGIDRNEKMLKLSRAALQEFADKIGYENISFLYGSIEKLDSKNKNKENLIEESTIDIVLSNCVLNLVNPINRKSLLRNIKRVLKPSGRLAISDIVSSKKVPIELQNNPDLWSGCISGAWEEEQFIEDFTKLGFKEVKYAYRSEKPWKVINDIEFRSVTLTGHLNGKD